ncbi:hypothetical protein HMPREF9624_01013 [Oribacterium asaccharolyticum ACB7]|uniref:Endonuclease GajA/Old nuclease/RecF-like AAA domain-containing protein n=1 Tax=Oribacterium asaccharolyticum ACB7 TaxID=796944 RepID=G9WVS9_9FIRM|nr:ATP-binding protein [Oribacterium asaccharolyticum]EHL10866.1 hypothetical protein HMPREF9624_01013 [Oribacterium asaccharolyticum ACB7]
MKMQAVVIDGFKNLSNVKIRFDNITALVALNNFGKSNVLSAIDFGIAFIKAGLEEKQSMMANSNLIPLNKLMLGRNYKYEMEVSTEIQSQEFIVKYGFEFNWRDSAQKEPQIVAEYLKVKENDNGKKFTQLINRLDSRAFYKSSETGRCSSRINVEPAELVVNKLRAFDGIYYYEIIKKLNNMKIYMEDNLDPRSFYLPDPIIRKGLESEMINADNLPRIIFFLKTQYSSKFELLKEVFLQLFPYIEDVIVEQFSLNGTAGDQIPDDAPFAFSKYIYVLLVKDCNLSNTINFEYMSDGAKRVFMILTKIIVSGISNVSLIAIEEPENSVHPGLFQAYIRIINQLLDDCKVIITSHSPYIVSYLDPAWIHVGLQKNPGVAEFYSFKKSGQKQLQSDAAQFNMGMGDYLFSLLSDSDDSLNTYLECDSNE